MSFPSQRQTSLGYNTKVISLLSVDFKLRMSGSDAVNATDVSDEVVTGCSQLSIVDAVCGGCGPAGARASGARRR